MGIVTDEAAVMDANEEDVPNVLCPRGYGFDIVMSPMATKCADCEYLREIELNPDGCPTGPEFACHAPSTEDIKDAEIAAGWDPTP